MLDRVAAWGLVLVMFGLISALVVPATYMVYWNYSSQDVILSKNMCIIAHRIEFTKDNVLMVEGYRYPIDPEAPYTFSHYPNFPSTEVGLSVTSGVISCRTVGPWNMAVDEYLEGSFGR